MEIVTNYIERIKQSDEKAFEAFFRLHYNDLCNYANHILKENVITEELVQDLFVKLWENRTDLNINENTAKSYLFRSVHNKCLNYIQHKKIKQDYQQHNLNTIEKNEQIESSPLEAKELEHKINGAIASLPTERQRIFKLSRFEGKKYKEIAEELSISVKTVENQMGKALQFLRTELKEYLPLIIIFFSHLNIF